MKYRFKIFLGLLFIVLSAIKCTQKTDYPGFIRTYKLSDGMVFTVWEKEPGVYGSEVLIIPGDLPKDKQLNTSYIKTVYTLYSPYFFYTLDSLSTNYNLLKNKIILKSWWEENDRESYEIVNTENSKWKILEYTDEYFPYIYYGANPLDSTTLILRNDISKFCVHIDRNSATSIIGQVLTIKAGTEHE